MKEIFDIVVWGGFAFLLFVFLRGFNEQQVKKHQDKLENIEKKKENKEQKEED
jgi:arginine exporter protein ArgO